MLLRILIIGALAIGLMIAIKQGTLLKGLGLLSNCEVVETPRGETGEWRACTEGKLDGRRNLSDICKPMGFSGEFEYWSCPPGATLSGRS
jgi:hypothetical protein